LSNGGVDSGPGAGDEHPAPSV